MTDLEHEARHTEAAEAARASVFDEFRANVHPYRGADADVLRLAQIVSERIEALEHELLAFRIVDETTDATDAERLRALETQISVLRARLASAL